VLKFSLDNDLEPDVDAMWELLLDANYQRRIHMEGLRFQDFTVVSEEERGEVMHRVTRVVPRVDMPGPIKKLLGESMSYQEFVSFDRGAKKWLWHLEMPGPGRKIKVGGRIEILPGRSGKGCLRRTHFEVEVKILGIGGLIEKTIKKETLENYERAAVFINANPEG
jgi:hypothetical protein